MCSNFMTTPPPSSQLFKYKTRTRVPFNDISWNRLLASAIVLRVHLPLGTERVWVKVKEETKEKGVVCRLHLHPVQTVDTKPMSQTYSCIGLLTQTQSACNDHFLQTHHHLQVPALNPLPHAEIHPGKTHPVLREASVPTPSPQSTGGLKSHAEAREGRMGPWGMEGS